MSLLLPNRKGNPAWSKGKSGNPDGRPRLGSTMGVKRTLAKLKRNPVEELINLADMCKANGDVNIAIKIWEKLYDDSLDSGLTGLDQKEQKSTAKLLEELEQDESRSKPDGTASSDKTIVGDGQTKAAS